MKNNKKMPPRKKDRKLLKSEQSRNKRLSDTPKIRTPQRTARNILSQNSQNSSQLSAASVSSIRRSSNNSQNLPSPVSSDILKVNWKVFRVSPLFNFNENKLKIYARKLKEELAAYFSKEENVQCDCTFQFQKSLLGQSYDSIQVLFSANHIKYKGYFISPEGGQCEEEFSNIRHFPVLLAHGGEKITQQVHNTICKFFDCDILRVKFPFKPLTTFFSSLAFMHIDDVSESSNEAVLLQYKIPGCPQSDSIKVELPLDGVSTVFAAFMVQYGDNLSDAQVVSGYYDKILKHLLNVYQVDLSYAELDKVIFPGFAVSSEGWVRFVSEKLFSKILPMICKFSGLQYICRN